VAIGPNGEIIVGTERPAFGTALLLAFDQAGAPLWSKNMSDSVLTAPAIRAGRIYVGTKASTVEALDLSTGNSLWSYAVPCPRLQNCEVGSAPAVTADRLVVFGTQNGTIYGVQDDNTRGVLVWKYDTSGAITGSPILSRNGLAYVGSENSHLYALYTATGGVAWDANTFASIKATPSLDNQSVLYVGSNDGILRTFGP
jgi:outer membrane protein assembly factor BamB